MERKQYLESNEITKLVCILTFLFSHSYAVINVNATTKRNFNDTSYNNLDSITVKSRLVQKNKINS